MPQIFKIGPYVIYFWSDENKPLEPIHVHVAEGVPHANATAVTEKQLCCFEVIAQKKIIPGSACTHLGYFYLIIGR